MSRHKMSKAGRVDPNFDEDRIEKCLFALLLAPGLNLFHNSWVEGDGGLGLLDIHSLGRDWREGRPERSQWLYS